MGNLRIFIRLKEREKGLKTKGSPDSPSLLSDCLVRWVAPFLGFLSLRRVPLPLAFSASIFHLSHSAQFCPLKSHSSDLLSLYPSICFVAENDFLSPVSMASLIESGWQVLSLSAILLPLLALFLQFPFYLIFSKRCCTRFDFFDLALEFKHSLLTF